MLQEILNNLAILCIDKYMLQKIDLEDIINDFTSQKARRNIFFLNMLIFVIEMLYLEVSTNNFLSIIEILQKR